MPTKKTSQLGLRDSLTVFFKAVSVVHLASWLPWIPEKVFEAMNASIDYSKFNSYKPLPTVIVELAVWILMLVLARPLATLIVKKDTKVGLGGGPQDWLTLILNLIGAWWVVDGLATTGGSLLGFWSAADPAIRIVMGCDAGEGFVYAIAGVLALVFSRRLAGIVGRQSGGRWH